MGGIQFAENLQRLREAYGMSRKELAELVGLSAGAIWNYEMSEREPCFRIMERLAEAFGITPGQLLDGIQRKKNTGREGNT